LNHWYLSISDTSGLFPWYHWWNTSSTLRKSRSRAFLDTVNIYNSRWIICFLCFFFILIIMRCLNITIPRPTILNSTASWLELYLLLKSIWKFILHLSIFIILMMNSWKTEYFFIDFQSFFTVSWPWRKMIKLLYYGFLIFQEIF